MNVVYLLRVDERVSSAVSSPIIIINYITEYLLKPVPISRYLSPKNDLQGESLQVALLTSLHR